MQRIPSGLRDLMMTEFRKLICKRAAIVPFEHQARWWALTDGQILLPDLREGLPSTEITLPSGEVVERSLADRTLGRARVVAELGAYKCGKSYGAALWAAGLAGVPNSKTYLVGIEYDMCAPEFEYLLEFLISDRGLGLKAVSLQNRPKDGRLWLELENGARFEARSWERAESLKGKEVDAYIFCEAYQLPGLECFMSIKQNLRARDGYAVFPTTPDSPWVAVLHENGHGNPEYPSWECCCGVPASVNPTTYSAEVQELDRKLMTREKYAIAYEGKIGTYIGRVFSFQRGMHTFDTHSHPDLWHDPAAGPNPANLRIPSNWTVEVGADTGTFWGAAVVAFDDLGRAYVLDELPNYRYAGGSIELDPDMSLVTWADRFKRMAAIWGAKNLAWVDTNSQFKHEFAVTHGIHLIGNPVGRQARTEALRQMFQHNRIWLAPWLVTIPYELEHAQWPTEATIGGKFERLKQNDHSLDGLEHVVARHPMGRPALGPPVPGYPTHHTSPRPRRIADPHLGRL